MSELDEYKRPWRVEQSPKPKKHGGYNYRIRSANNYYIAEYLSDGDLAQHIVSAVNERDQLRAALAAATQRVQELERSAAYELARRGQLAKWYATYVCCRDSGGDASAYGRCCLANCPLGRVSDENVNTI